LEKEKLLCDIFLAIALVMVPPSCLLTGEKIGVIFVIHGGMIENKPQYMWDAVAHQFSYDPNHSVYKLIIWNPASGEEGTYAIQCKVTDAKNRTGEVVWEGFAVSAI